MRLALAALLFTLPVYAADRCPEGCISSKPPTCDERLSRLKKAGCPLPVETKIVTHATSVPAVCPDCPQPKPCEPCPPCPEATPTYQPPQPPEPEPPQPEGHTFVAAGPIWLNNWGLTAVAGHKFASGLIVQGGPIWLPRDGTSGYTTCPPREGGAGPGGTSNYCRSVPFSVHAQQNWGAQALIGYSW